MYINFFLLIFQVEFHISQDFTIIIHKTKKRKTLFNDLFSQKMKKTSRTSLSKMRERKKNKLAMESYQDHQQFFHSLTLNVEDHAAATFAWILHYLNKLDMIFSPWYQSTSHVSRGYFFLTHSPLSATTIIFIEEVQGILIMNIETLAHISHYKHPKKIFIIIFIGFSNIFFYIFLNPIKKYLCVISLDVEVTIKLY